MLLEPTTTLTSTWTFARERVRKQQTNVPSRPTRSPVAKDKARQVSKDAEQLGRDAEAEARKVYGDAKNLGHSAVGEIKGAFHDTQAKGYDAMAEGQKQTGGGGGGLLDQAENKTKSLWQSVQGEGERLKGQGKGDAAELKEVSLECIVKVVISRGRRLILFVGTIAERKVHVQVISVAFKSLCVKP